MFIGILFFLAYSVAFVPSCALITRLEQFLNAFFSMVVTLLGIVVVAKFSQSSNALYPI